MTDKQFIETLKNIQDYCRSRLCDECKFSNFILKSYMLLPSVETTETSVCTLRNIILELSAIPGNWDIAKIERILKENDQSNIGN